LEILAVLLGVVIPMALASGQAKRPLEAGDLFMVMRISNPALSPHGKRVVYVASIPHTQEDKNRSSNGFEPL